MNFAQTLLGLAVLCLPGWASLYCDGTRLYRSSDNQFFGDFSEPETCKHVIDRARAGVVCTWFTPDMPIGAGGWSEAGWRPRNIETGVGLGRKTLNSLEQCLVLSENANGGVVCTHTGLGFKPTSIVTNHWCGSSSEIQYCIQASAASVRSTTCSFPSSGTGAESGWVQTTITSSCSYQGAKQSIQACTAALRP